ncbi:hypothetical protein BaRGS_00022159 [Batillaria attramentaria]|uniref:SUEL-type lectin domain-containing protein n=1 Tax=Batillaria attramentaria TaxID=370345 RepID=A0ABD0KHI5_9CAEN
MYRPVSHVCRVPVLCVQVLLDLCEDHAQCQVLATSTTFRQDPCPTTSKYLEVHYKCRPNEFDRQTVCEGEQMELACRKSSRIAIYSAMFGRAPNGTSPCPPNRPGYIDCQSAETVSEVRTACQGRKRCDLQATEAVFGNPCATGINKYLTVTYTCVPKRILKELRRHRGRPSRNRKRKHRHKKPSVTKLTTEVHQNLGTTSPSRALSESQSTEVQETYVRTETQKNTSPGEGHILEGQVTTQHIVKNRTPAPSSVITSTPQYPVILTGSKNTPSYTRDNDPPVRPSSDIDSYPPNRPSSGRDGYTPNRPSTVPDWYRPDRLTPVPERDKQGSSNVNRPLEDSSGNSNVYKPSGGSTGVSDVNWPQKGSSGISDRNRPFGGRPDRTMSTMVPDSVAPSVGPVGDTTQSVRDLNTGRVNESNLTVLCANNTVPSVVRTLPSNHETPVGIIKDWFAAVRFLQTHQEKAVLYMVVGVCFGLILLLLVVLGRVCVQLKRNTHAKLDMSEPTHSRNVSRLHNHTGLDTPMLDHSDSIDRIEVVRFEPRGTLRSGYHSTLHSDSGDRSLCNYYG